MDQPPDWVLGFLSAADMDALSAAIAAAESGTSAEVRVHLERACIGDPVTRAIELFEQLGMQRTALRNGVLVYIAIGDHRLAVIGDRGVHDCVGQAYWTAVAARLGASLRSGPHVRALTDAVADIGRTLARYFPRGPDDRNELSDRVSLR